MVIAANAFIIFLGGYETTSSTLAFLFLELAAHQHIQDEVREEIKQVYLKHDGKMTSEMLQDLTYMDMVIQGNFLVNSSITRVLLISKIWRKVE